MLICLQYKNSIIRALAQSGYNVAVAITNIQPGSIVVTSSTQFLDGSTTGAQQFAAALSDPTVVASLFPTATYGSVTVSGIAVASTKNPSKWLSFDVSALFDFCAVPSYDQ